MAQKSWTNEPGTGLKQAPYRGHSSKYHRLDRPKSKGWVLDCIQGNSFKDPFGFVLATMAKTGAYSVSIDTVEPVF